MEAFSVGQVIKAKTGNDEYTIIEVTSNTVVVRARSSGMNLLTWSKADVKNQIAAGVWEVK